MQATTVAARGKAEVPYTIANFSISLSAKGSTVPSSKKKLQIQVDDLNKSLETIRTSLGLEFIKNSVRASSSVQEDWQYKSNKNEFIGYIINYNLSFQIDKLDKVNEVYDILTSLDNVKVASPGFGLKPVQREKLNKKALKDAFAKASDRFDAECKILGLDSTEFEIANWEVTYGDSQRGNRVASGMSARSMMNSRSDEDDVYEGAIACAAPAGGGASSALELVAGLAEVTVNLEVGYARKTVQPTQTIKAKVVKSSSHSENANV